MSKIGRVPISIPSGVTVTVQPDQVVVKGPKGELSTKLVKGISVAVEDNAVVVTRANDEIQTKAFHGLVRSLIENTIEGVTNGYKKTLKLTGTGYRVTQKGQGISLAVGFSHPVEVAPADGVKVTTEGQDTIHIEGIDKQAVGQMAANIRKVRPPEPYKGKGIRYENEEVRRKQGKTAA
jgi:large subunit ribosomal protein L6